MQIKHLSFAALAATTSAQSLTQALARQPQLSNLTTYLNLFPSFVSQLESLSNITLLAPDNQAFNALLGNNNALASNTGLIQALFSYHVLNGSYANFSSSPAFIPTALMNTTYANVTGGQVVEAVGTSNGSTFYTGLLNNASTIGNVSNFTGGSIHIIDSFLTIPENCSQTAIELGTSSLVGALEAANLVSAVDGLSDVTVFVPNNRAFQDIAGTLATLPIANVTNILEYHVINGTVGYSTALSNMTLTTLQGGNLRITVENGTVFVNSARVIVPNVLVANGVIHVIDNMLNPANSTATANPSQTSGSPAFSGASSASNAPFTSGVPTPTSSINTACGGAANSAATSASAASSTSSGGAMPMKTGAMGAAALFGGAAVVMNM